MNTTSSAGYQRRMASIASRVLPAPPGPVKLISRDLPSSSESSASSCSRPTKLVGATAMGPGRTAWAGGAAWPDGAVWPDGAAWPDEAVWPDEAAWSGGAARSSGAAWPVGSDCSDGSAWADGSAWTAAISALNWARAALARADILVRPASHRFTVANDTDRK